MTPVKRITLSTGHYSISQLDGAKALVFSIYSANDFADLIG